MIKIWMQSRNDRSRFETRIFLAVLVIVVTIGFGATTYTASGAERGRLPAGRMGYFDPFKLTTIDLNVPESAPMTGFASPRGTVFPPRVIRANAAPVYRCPIMIPHRPPIRSPFRPPWIPGHRPIFKFPGRPPWAHPGPLPWWPYGRFR